MMMMMITEKTEKSQKKRVDQCLLNKFKKYNHDI